MNFLRNTTITFGSNFGILLLGLLTSTLLARTLGPYGRGLMTTILIWPQMLAWAAGMSLGYANIYYGSSGPLVRRQLFANSFWVALVLGTLVGGTASFILPRYVPLTSQQHTLLTIILWTLPIALWMDYATTLLNSTNRFGQLGLVRLTSPILTVICLLILWETHLLTVLSAVLTGWAGSWIMFGSVLRCLALDGCISFRPDIALLRQSFSYASKMHIGTLANLANGRLDQLVMTAIVAPKAIGLYAFSVTLSELLKQIAASVATVLYPKVSGEMDDHERGILAARTTRWMLIVVSICAITLFFVAPWIVPFVWGNRFVEAVPTLRVLLPGTVALCVAITMVTSLRGSGKPGVTSTAELVSLVVMTPLLWLLVPKMGIFGAGLASTCGYGVYCSITAWYFTKIFGKESFYSICPTLNDWRHVCTIFKQRRLKFHPQPAALK